MSDRIKALEIENKRLREAIEYFMDSFALDGPDFEIDEDDDELNELKWAFDLFREALNGETKNVL